MSLPLSLPSGQWVNLLILTNSIENSGHTSAPGSMAWCLHGWCWKCWWCWLNRVRKCKQHDQWHELILFISRVKVLCSNHGKITHSGMINSQTSLLWYWYYWTPCIFHSAVSNKSFFRANISTSGTNASTRVRTGYKRRQIEAVGYFIISKVLGVIL